MAKYLFAVLLLLLSPEAWAEIKSGVYNGLILGVDGATGAITGYYESYTGIPDKSGVPPFRCIFFLVGRLEGPAPYKIKTWFPGDRNPDVIEGTLEVGERGPNPGLGIKLEKEHGGCWNVQHFADEPAFMEIEEAGDWRSVRVIASARAYFHNRPNAGERRKAYAVKGNPVRVYEVIPDWVRAAYVNDDGKKTEGWIKESDLFSAIVPIEN
jgi:hypothetical protein